MPDPQFGSIVVLQHGKYDFLIDNALRDVWCNPDQDNQHRIAPYRITPPNGAMNFANVMMRTMELPSKGAVYHLFQIGNLDPALIGLFQISPLWTSERWVSIADGLANETMIAEVYGDNGIMLPKYETFYCFNADNDLILAVKENNKIPFAYRKDKIYLRVYSNAYFNSVRDSSRVKSTYSFGARVGNRDHMLQIQSEFEKYEVKPGKCFCYVNGYLVRRLDAVTMAIGDFVEFVYDSSVKRTVTFKVKNLPVFNSELDGKRKYLLHYPAGTDEQIIDYVDDIDVYVIDRLPNNKMFGVYYHKNVDDALRMVTHRDYSVCLQYFAHFASQLQVNAGDRLIDTQELEIQLIIRESGYRRPLIFESSRINELYKLSDAGIIDAMCSTINGLSIWSASKLEKSAYTSLMRSDATAITQDMVEEAYGYNSVSKLLGESPLQTTLYSGKQRVNVPKACQFNSTVYEFDDKGLFLGAYSHQSGNVYTTINDTCRTVEFFVGIGGVRPDVRFGDVDKPIPIDQSSDYRVYRCTKTAFGIDDKWEDVTGSNKYVITDNKLIWSPTDFNAYVMVRTNGRFLSYDLNMKCIGGSLAFTFSEFEDRGNGAENYKMPVPMGELAIFLNKRYLIEGVDYFVKFPEVIIINKEFLNTPRNSADQQIHIRFTGFCDNNLKHRQPEEQGWIIQGLLSKNHSYDVRDDRNMEFVVGGSLIDRSKLTFAETHSGLGITNPRNGLPYQIRDIVVPMRSFVGRDTYAYRDEAITVNKAIGDYLSTRIPEPSNNGISAIRKRYEVYSPFLARIIYDLEVGLLPITHISNNLTDGEVIGICKPYEKYLKFDPINPENNVDSDFVIIHPHNDYVVKNLNIIQYRFLTRVVKLYGNGLIELSPFIGLKTTP